MHAYTTVAAHFYSGFTNAVTAISFSYNIVINFSKRIFMSMILPNSSCSHRVRFYGSFIVSLELLLLSCSYNYIAMVATITDDTIQVYNNIHFDSIIKMYCSTVF